MLDRQGLSRGEILPQAQGGAILVCQLPWATKEVPTEHNVLPRDALYQWFALFSMPDVCSQTERVMVVGGRKKHKDRARVGSKDTIQPPLPSGHVLKEGNPQMPPGKAQEGESCLRTADCVRGLCCARHFWAKVCKPVLMEGQVCSRRGGQKEGAQGPEIFQRCNCGPGLSCQLPLGGAPQRSRLRVCLRN
ncbi:hypothetical protein JD844_030892 [Phrynosoma platyrhinos]|uniref:Dickkopf-related protein 4 n=1 Tax=Phrynosoma platyrhinos TaxID=52577 RepID=A0ABQ7SZY3_PHRPL|nr:hypothetical protein JD844_030892 [Phrynosoma platyrhinos]